MAVLTGLRAGRLKKRSSICSKGKRFLSSCKRPDRIGCHTASCSVGMKETFPVVNWLRSIYEHSLPSSAEGKNEWNPSSPQSYACVFCTGIILYCYKHVKLNIWTDIAGKRTFVLMFLIKLFIKFFTKTSGVTFHCYMPLLHQKTFFFFSSRQTLCGRCDCDVSLETENSTEVFGKKPSCTLRNVYIIKQRALVIQFQCKLKNTSKNLFNFLCCRVNWMCLKKIKIFLHVKQDFFPVLSHLFKIYNVEGK
jgi:hypothetical protein